MDKLKVVVVGTGHLGSIHTKLWKENAVAKLVGIFDTDKQKSEKLANEYSISSFNSLDDAINAADAITIASPTIYHFEIAKKCIEAGKHCFIEKPITSKYEDALELMKLAEDKKVLIQVGHVERFNPAISALKGYQLNPVFIEAHRLSQFRPRAIDVSVIHDLMIHDIDIMLWLVKSKVAKVEANGVAVLTETTDIANARITFENGAVANLTASRISANPMRKMRFFQKNAYISIDFGNQDVEVYTIKDADEKLNDGAIPATMLGVIEAGLKNKNIYFEKPNAPKLNAIAEEQQAFVNAILNNEPIAVSAKDAAEALRIAEIIASQVNN